KRGGQGTKNKKKNKRERKIRREELNETNLFQSQQPLLFLLHLFLEILLFSIYKFPTFPRHEVFSSSASSSLHLDQRIARIGITTRSWIISTITSSVPLIPPPLLLNFPQPIHQPLVLP